MVGSTMTEIGATECPHKAGTPEHREWTRAFTGQVLQAREVNGTARRDTDAIKALADADFRAAGYGRPDPVVGILGPPEIHRVSIQISPELIVSIDVAARALSDAFDRAYQAIKAAVSTIDVTALEQALKGVTTSIRSGDEVPLKERARHGSAASCPRHGATRGGTCMKCARGRR